MSLRIQTNVDAMGAYRHLDMTTHLLSKSQEKLSSGYRINRAADDAAGLSISDKLEAQVRGLQMSQRNTQDAISLVQTAEGALGEVQSMLQRTRELAIQLANGTLSASDQAAITAESVALGAEISRIAANTAFNGVALFTGVGTQLITFQVGQTSAQSLTIGVAFLTATTMACAFLFSLACAWTAIASLDASIQNIATVRSGYGAVQNRLEHTYTSLQVQEENLAAANSRIRDTDMAKEITNYTKLQILQQSGTSVLGQATQAPSSVLSLLK